MTHDLPPAAELPAPFASHAVSAPAARDLPSSRVRGIVLIVMGACAALAAIAIVVVRTAAGDRK